MELPCVILCLLQVLPADARCFCQKLIATFGIIFLNLPLSNYTPQIFLVSRFYCDIHIFYEFFFSSVNLCQANNRCAELSGDSCFTDEFYLQIFFCFLLFEFLRGSGQCYGREIITSFDWFCNWIKVEMSVVIESRQNGIFLWAITRVHIQHQSSFFSFLFFWIEWRKRRREKRTISLLVFSLSLSLLSWHESKQTIVK